MLYPQYINWGRRVEGPDNKRMKLSSGALTVVTSPLAAYALR
jgi:hypothetical protein